MAGFSWDRIGDEFPVKDNYIFLNHAAVSPIPARTQAAVAKIASEQRDHGTGVYGEWLKTLVRARHNLARLMGADASEVAFVKNTTSGLIIVAEGIPWREGDNVVIPSVEFPANVFPWLNLARRGVQTREVSPVDGGIRIDDILAAMDERTRAVSVSWVQYSNGFRIDIATLAQACHERGAMLVVDGIQGLGAIPLDAHALGIDFLVADGHKWLLSVEGCGALYVSRGAMEKMSPVNVGWMSMDDPEDYENHSMRLRGDARRFEEGTHNMIGCHALGASAELLLEAGPDEVWRSISGLTDRLVEGLQSLGCEIRSPLGDGRRSGVISFSMPGKEPARIVEHLGERKISVAARAGGVRVAPHFYNDADEIDTVLAALREI